MTDHPLGDVTPDTPGDGQHDPSEHDPGAHRPLSSGLLTVEDVLAAARLVERTASICLRADLTAEHDRVLDELGTLVTPGGELLADDDELGMDAQSNAARARDLSDQLQQIKAEMRASMWHVRFRAMDSDAWSAFKKQHMPTAKGADMTEFRTKLVAECAIEPAITETQVRQLRKKLNSSQFVDLSDTAFAACTTGGLDIPKSPNSWANLGQQ